MGYNKSMKKPTIQEKPKTNRRKSIIIGVGLVLAVAAIGLGGVKLEAQSDARRFAEAETKKNIALNQLVSRLGSPTKIENLNVCYDAEQEPYNSGKLWCRVSSAAFYTEQKYSDKKVEGLMLEIIRNNSWKTTDQRAAAVEFEAVTGLPCQLQVDRGRFATHPSYRFSPVEDAQLAIILVCSDRAKAKHYEYIP